jgi:hypothetical protein
MNHCARRLLIITIDNDLVESELIARLGESDDFELHRAFLPSKPRRGKAPITHARPPATSWNPQIAQIFTDSRRGAQATTTVILSGAPKERRWRREVEEPRGVTCGVRTQFSHDGIDPQMTQMNADGRTDSLDRRSSVLYDAGCAVFHDEGHQDAVAG